MKVNIIGKDERSNYLRKIYAEKIVKFEDADYIFCPIPFTRDGIKINGEELKIDELIYKIKGRVLVSGAINEDVRKKLQKNNIKFIDLMNFEEFSLMNAIATSEGAIKKAIEMTDFTLNNSNIMVMGYGRIGKILAHQLSSFGAKIYVEARKNTDIALIKSIGYNVVDLKDIDKYIGNMDIIFNTIPHIIIDEKRVELLKENVCIIDLASNPGGVDFEALKKRNINTSWYLQIPSKDSPYTAAKYIKDTLDKIIGEEETWEKKLT